MTYDVPSTLLGIAAGLAVGYTVHLFWRLRYTKLIRSDAIKRSQAVSAGKAYEQLAPFLPGFEFDSKDARFLGSPVDLIVFDGLSQGHVRRVVFVEVKTGQSHLSDRERQVRDVITARSVEWLEVRGA